jgi:hypothetical protein
LPELRKHWADRWAKAIGGDHSTLRQEFWYRGALASVARAWGYRRTIRETQFGLWGVACFMPRLSPKRIRTWRKEIRNKMCCPPDNVTTIYNLAMAKHIYVQLAGVQAPIKVNADKLEKQKDVFILKKGDETVGELVPSSVVAWWIEEIAPRP